MKFYAFLLFLVVATIMSMASADDSDVDDCAKCISMPDDEVCATTPQTYRNLCELQCNDAEFMHKEKCTFEELCQIDSNDD